MQVLVWVLTPFACVAAYRLSRWAWRRGWWTPGDGSRHR